MKLKVMRGFKNESFRVFLRPLLHFIGFLLLISCTTVSVQKNFVIRDHREFQLQNGLKVLLLQDKSLPYVSVNLMLHAGSASDPPLYLGLTSFVTKMLDRGTQKHSALELADAFARLGTGFSASTDRDYTLIAASTLSRHQKPLFELLGEVMIQPSFPEAEIERYRQQVLAALQTIADKPSAYAQKMYNEYLFGSHPYGRSPLGLPKSVLSIQKKQVLEHYSKVFRPNNATLAVVGDFDENIGNLLETSFKDWEAQTITPPAFPKKTAIKNRLIRLVTKNDLVQAEIRIGHFGIQRSHPDFLKLRVANTILGRGFTSRLMDHIRDNLGLTYSIGSEFDARLDQGPFSIMTFTKNQTAGQTIKEILATLDTFYKKGVTSKEVFLAKKYLLGVFPQALDTPEKLAFNLLILRFYGIPDDYLKTYRSTISRITVSQVNRAIKKHIDPHHLKILVYANEEVLPQLRPLGLVEVRHHTDL